MRFTPITWDVPWASAVFGVFVLIASLIRLFWMRLILPIQNRNGVALDEGIVLSGRRLATWGVLLLGLYYALASLRSAQAYPRTIELLGKALGIGWGLLAIWTLVSATHAILRW